MTNVHALIWLSCLLVAGCGGRHDRVGCEELLKNAASATSAEEEARAFRALNETGYQYMIVFFDDGGDEIMPHLTGQYDDLSVILIQCPSGRSSRLKLHDKGNIDILMNE